MPGTGHSARYKGSISNRVKKSPFQELAEWNAQLLGADGSVPTITGGGGGLAFKKLDASDIDGVMHNPATEDLDMNGFDIFTSTGNLGLIWKDDGHAHNIRIGGNNSTGGARQVLIMTDGSGTRVTIGSSTLGECHLVGEVVTLSGADIAIGTGSANTNVNIGTGSANTNVTIGNTNSGGDTVTTIHGGGFGGGSGSVKIGAGGVIGQTVQIGNSAGKIGFFGKTPRTRPNCWKLAGTAGTPSFDEVVARINYIITILDEGGAGPLADGLGLIFNGGTFNNTFGGEP